MKLKRRQMLLGMAAITGCGAPKSEQKAGQTPAKQGKPLDLGEFQPKSMLVAPETKIEKSRFPVIDIHTHLCFSARSENGVSLTGERRFLAPPEELLPVMDRRNLKTLVNLTGGYGSGLKDAVQRYDAKYPGRFFTFTEPDWSRANQSDYPKLQADAIRQAKRDGARGLKVVKTLGLYLRENITSGALLKVDDKRFDPMWEACGALNLPVAIHVSDPVAFFAPIDRFNERFEELNNHPDWSFYGKDFPSNADLLEARNRVMERHPKTQFIVLHVGNFAEDLGHVGRVDGSMPEHARRTRRARRRTGPAAPRIPQVLREVPGPHPVRDRRGPARRRNPAAGIRRSSVPDLLPVSGDRRRVLRLRAGRHTAAGTLADLRDRAARKDPPQGLLRQRRAPLSLFVAHAPTSARSPACARDTVRACAVRCAASCAPR